MKKNTIIFSCLTAIGLSTGLASVHVDFSDMLLSTPPATAYAGGGVYNNTSGGFTSGGVSFANPTSQPNFWDGWAYSTTTDTTTAGFGNQFSASTGSGYNDAVYGVYYQPFVVAPTVLLDASSSAPQSMRVTNTTYAALSMASGDGFAKAFGGASGDDADWFLLTVIGYDSDENVIGTVEHYLADFRSADNTEDYITTDWDLVDLTGLGTNVASLQFELSSSDVGDYGMNTPAYFAMDDFIAVPEASSFALISGLLAMLAVCRRSRR